MRIKGISKYFAAAGIFLLVSSCVPSALQKAENKSTPASYKDSQDTVNSAGIKWRTFFHDKYLSILIDSALKNNQELNVVLQEIRIAQNEVRARKGAYLPFADVGASAGLEKTPRYTRNGATEATTQIAPGKEFPDPLPDYMIGANFSWEVDIWKKLRNAKKSAVYNYLATTAGKNFMVTHLISEIANSYYELMALDNQYDILRKNIEIQTNALEIVKQEKEAAKVTELAVRRFEAEVLKNKSRQYYISQQIVVAENRINFLVGRFPQTVYRNSPAFFDLVPDTIQAGIPSQLLRNRPDITQAELGLAAAKLDIRVARAYFYPSLNISASAGLQAFSPTYLVSKAGSTFYNLAAGLSAPLVNRNAIKAAYYSANSKQIQAAFNYEKAILNAYIEVVNQLSNISNLEKSYALKAKQVKTLTESIDISTRLFKSARADYMEVLLTQRDALESRFDLVETNKLRMNAMVNVYQALGGGWN